MEEGGGLDHHKFVVRRTARKLTDGSRAWLGLVLLSCCAAHGACCRPISRLLQRLFSFLERHCVVHRCHFFPFFFGDFA